MEDLLVRNAAFNWLARQVDLHGDVLPRSVLVQGFTLEGERVPLISRQGIFKPRVIPTIPLTITTSPHGPYQDRFDAFGMLIYKYRGENPTHRDNVGLRMAMQHRIPLIHFQGIVPGKYLATWPVYIVQDDPLSMEVKIQVDDAGALADYPATTLAALDPGVADESRSLRRAYVTAEVRVRLHQRMFRERVLAAYRRQCAFCRFRHEEMLDAAHIVPDSHPNGEPVVRNGLSLCSLHHRAFDNHLIGVSPDYRLHVRPDVLREKDGPTLAHAIQALDKGLIELPKLVQDRPDQQALEHRFASFLRAVG